MPKQVMTAENANGITETKNLHIFAACCKWAGWAHYVADGVWQRHSMTLPSHWRIILQWFLWQHPPTLFNGWPRSF